VAVLHALIIPLAIIHNDCVPPLDNTAGSTPPLNMPSWKSVLSDKDIHRIADYLWSRQRKAKDAW
jgi:hypothetical protein